MNIDYSKNYRITVESACSFYEKRRPLPNEMILFYLADDQKSFKKIKFMMILSGRVVPGPEFCDVERVCFRLEVSEDGPDYVGLSMSGETKNIVTGDMYIPWYLTMSKAFCEYYIWNGLFVTDEGAQPVDDHSGQIYNPFTDSWSWF